MRSEGIDGVMGEAFDRLPMPRSSILEYADVLQSIRNRSPSRRGMIVDAPRVAGVCKDSIWFIEH